MTMKYFLFLPVLIATLHLSKAGPLRLQKRAAFYIANETACVVDNIVYSSGDPIPTEDPCESCKCRPPGFACVLEDCKAKPGCRAVRHAGQCCPEYVCGCEHNGRMYSDGEQIRDEKNPCYECYCQGSSIACAFVDCFFRVDCVAVYVPGQCCPDYKNCTRDAPERTTFTGDNALPPVSLLPGLYDESVLPGHIPSTELSETTEKLSDPTQPPAAEEEIVESAAEEVKEYPEPKIPTVEEIKPLNPGVEEKVPETNEDEKPSSEKDTPKEESIEKHVEETKVLLNSETEIKPEDSVDVTTVKEVAEDDELTTQSKDTSTESVPEVREEDPGTTLASDADIVENEAEEITETNNKAIPTSTELPETEKAVKNSAAENSKSLRLIDNETADKEKIADAVSEETEIQDSDVDNKETKKPESVREEQLTTEKPGDSKVIDSTENKSGGEETKAEESIADPQSIAFYADDDKVIKKESAETVTIVVHVREKSKPSTVADFVTEKATTDSAVTSEPKKEISLKSSDGLENVEVFKESTAVPESTGKNFEVFPTSTEISKDESTTASEEVKEKIEERSESDPMNSNIGKTAFEEESTVNSDVDLSATVTSQSVSEDVTEVNKEARSDEEISVVKKDEEVAEIIEEKKAEKAEEDSKVTEEPEDLKVTETQDEAKVTEIKEEHPKVALKIEIEMNSETQSPKIKEITVEAEKEKIKEESKLDEKIEDIKPEDEPEPKSEEILEEKTEESKSEEKKEELQSGEKSEENVEESQPDVKVDEAKLEEKSDEIKLEGTTAETINDEKEDEIKTEKHEENSKPEEAKDVKPEERSEITEENIDPINVESTNSEEEKEQVQTEKTKLLKDQETEKPSQPEKPKDSE